jgi:hypothetical protein
VQAASDNSMLVWRPLWFAVPLRGCCRGHRVTLSCGVQSSLHAAAAADDRRFAGVLHVPALSLTAADSDVAAVPTIHFNC